MRRATSYNGKVDAQPKVDNGMEERSHRIVQNRRWVGGGYVATSAVRPWIDDWVVVDNAD